MRVPIPARWSVYCFLTGALLFFGAGCSEEARHVTPPAPVEFAIEGALLPEFIDEGEAITVSVWGERPSSGWTLDRFEARIDDRPEAESAAHPEGVPGHVEIFAMGRESGAPADGQPGGVPFRESVSLPALEPGAWIVTCMVRGSRQEQTLHVLPRDAWVRYRSYGDPVESGFGLLVARAGEAIAFQEGVGRTRPVKLTPETLAEITAWFRTAGFYQLEDTYLSDERRPVRHVEITLRGDATPKRVLAEAALMPEALATLEAHLSQMTHRLLASSTHLPDIVGQITIEPVDADPGTERHLQLTLTNRTTNEVTLGFPTGQQFDLLVMRPMRHHPPGANGDPNDEPGPHPVIWQWSSTRDFDPNPSALVLGPNEAKSFDVVWDGKTDESEIVGPGYYEVVARVPATDRRVPVTPARFRVNGRTPEDFGLVATLRVEPNAAPQGTARTFTLAVTNVSEQPIVVTFPTTQRYDLAADDPRIMSPMIGNLWLWSRYLGFGDAFGEETWAPGETKTFTEVWDGRTNRPMENPGYVVVPGMYHASGWIPGRPGAHTLPTSFVVLR